MMVLLTLLACPDPDEPVDSEASGSETAAPLQWSELLIEPDGAVLFVGATVRARVSAVGPQGRVDVGAELSLEGPGSLDAGQLTAEGEGTLLLSATYEGLQAQASIEVRDDGLLAVRVVDLQGEPVPKARVVVDGERSETDLEGRAVLEVADGPLAITVYGEDSSVVPTTFIGVLVRDLVLPLRPDAGRAPDSTLAGVVDFSDSLPPQEGQAGIAIVGRSLVDHPLLLDADDLLSEKRPVDFFGLAVDVPGNVAIQDLDEGFTVPAWAGPGGAWVLAGPMDVAALLTASKDVAATVEALTADPTVFRYTRVAAVAPDSHLTLVPDQLLESAVSVVLPTVPEDAGTPLLVALEPTLEGLAPTGLGTSTLYSAGSPTQVLAYIEQGGVGTGGARALQVSPVVDGEAVIEPFQDFPVIASFDGASRAFSITTDPHADFVRVWIVAADGTRRDLYMPSGSVDEVIPYEGPEMGYGLTTWVVLSMELEKGTWEQVLTDGGLGDVSEDLRSTAFLDEERNGG